MGEAVTVTRWTSEDASQDPRGEYVAYEDCKALVEAVRDLVAYNGDPGSCECRGCELIRRVLKALPA